MLCAKLDIASLIREEALEAVQNLAKFHFKFGKPYEMKGKIVLLPALVMVFVCWKYIFSDSKPFMSESNIRLVVNHRDLRQDHFY